MYLSSLVKIHPLVQKIMNRKRSYALANGISTVCKITCLGVSSIQQRVNCLLAVVCGCTGSGFSSSQCNGLLDL